LSRSTFVSQDGADYSPAVRGGVGGGIITITATNFTLHGTVNACGGAGASDGTDAGNGGGGGFVRVLASAIEGRGKVDARGGDSGVVSPGKKQRKGGGGGVVWLSFTPTDISSTTLLSDPPIAVDVGGGSGYPLGLTQYCGGGSGIVVLDALDDSDYAGNSVLVQRGSSCATTFAVGLSCWPHHTIVAEAGIRVFMRAPASCPTVRTRQLTVNGEVTMMNDVTPMGALHVALLGKLNPTALHVHGDVTVAGGEVFGFGSPFEVVVGGDFTLEQGTFASPSSSMSITVQGEMTFGEAATFACSDAMYVHISHGATLLGTFLSFVGSLTVVADGDLVVGGSLTSSTSITVLVQGALVVEQSSVWQYTGTCHVYANGTIDMQGSWDGGAEAAARPALSGTGTGLGFGLHVRTDVVLDDTWANTLASDVGAVGDLLPGASGVSGSGGGVRTLLLAAVLTCVCLGVRCFRRGD